MALKLSQVQSCRGHVNRWFPDRDSASRSKRNEHGVYLETEAGKVVRG